VNLSSTVKLFAYGTSQGVREAWDTRGRGRAPRATVPHLNRSKMSKEYYVPVTSEKIQLAKESVAMLAAAIGGTVTPDNSPWDILKNGTKIGIEVKRFLPGRKNLKIKIHSKGEGEPYSSKEKKVEFADKHNMKAMYVVAHDTHDPAHEKWYVRRAGDVGDPRADPNDPRTGWNYHIDNMQGGSLQTMKKLIK
jgi:hypothetical protein